MDNGVRSDSESGRDEILRVAIVPAVGTDSYLSTRALRALGRRWLMACVLVCAATVISYVATYLLERMYLAEIRFVHSRGSEELGGLDRILGQLGNIGALAGLTGAGGDGLRDEDVTLLTSGDLLRRFVEARQLLPILFEEDWDAAAADWKADISPADRPTTQDAVRLLQEKVVSVVDDRGASVITLRVRWKDPQAAAEWANGLVSLVNQHVRERAHSEADRSIDFLNRALESTDVVATREAIFRLIEAQTKSVMLATVRQDFAFRVIDPAVPAEPDDYVSPNRPIIALLAGILALFAFVIAVAWRAASNPGRE